jgi:hypothetical protein
VLVNNKAEGSSPLTVMALARQLAQPQPAAPRTNDVEPAASRPT